MKREQNLLFACCITLWLISGTVAGQKFREISQAEDSLSEAFSAVKHARDDSLRLALNRIFAAGLARALELPSAEDYPFDSLRNLVKLSSPDSKFRIFQWNLPMSGGSYRYYGFIRMTGTDPPAIYPLHDISDSLAWPDTAILENPHWYGALYYQAIPGKTATGEDIYTLLGWSGRDAAITRKLIDVLSFDPAGRPRFGMRLFPGYHDGNNARIIFRYSASAALSVKYEKHTVEHKGSWDQGKRTFDTESAEVMMIVFERLVPLEPEMEGMYEYHVPSGDLFDGFFFRNGIWVFISGIDPQKTR
jgi:hypothetical protein